MSIAAFAGMCDGAENDMEAASADDTTMNAIDIVRIEQWGGGVNTCGCMCVDTCGSVCLCLYAFYIVVQHSKFCAYALVTHIMSKRTSVIGFMVSDWKHLFF